MAARPATARLALLRHAPLTQTRLSHAAAKSTPPPHAIPAPTPFVPDVATFLKLIGRSSAQHASKLPSWEALFGASSESLRALGVEPPRARRYLLRWRDRFRKGRFGPGGDLAHVSNGVAELRVVPAGARRVVVNAPLSSPEGREWMREPPADAARVPWARVAHPGVVSAAFATPVAGTEGKVARVTVAEGMWEDGRGHKVGGGERWMRRQKTLAERRKRGLVV
jgi:hypothetical protein